MTRHHLLAGAPQFDRLAQQPGLEAVDGHLPSGAVSELYGRSPPSTVEVVLSDLRGQIGPGFIREGGPRRAVRRDFDLVLYSEPYFSQVDADDGHVRLAAIHCAMPARSRIAQQRAFGIAVERVPREVCLLRGRKPLAVLQRARSIDEPVRVGRVRVGWPLASRLAPYDDLLGRLEGLLVELCPDRPEPARGREVEVLRGATAGVVPGVVPKTCVYLLEVLVRHATSFVPRCFGPARGRVFVERAPR